MGGFFDWKDVEQEHVLQLLGAMRKLYADPDKWLLWPRAENESGQVVSPCSLSAAKWSLLGAGEMCAAAIFIHPLCDYVECAMRDLLDDLSDGKAIHGMKYEDEYALICLAYEHLTPTEMKETI
jgi:hypothetical protein